MIDSQISNVQNTSDVICNWIIEVLSYTCKYYNVTYGELNISLLCICALIICLYTISAIFKNKTLTNITLFLTIISMIGIGLMFCLVPLPNIF
jgi:hypothetical protein